MPGTNLFLGAGEGGGVSVNCYINFIKYKISFRRDGFLKFLISTECVVLFVF